MSFDELQTEKCLLIHTVPGVYVSKQDRESLDYEFKNENKSTRKLMRPLMNALVHENLRKTFLNTPDVTQKYKDEIKAARHYIRSKRNDFVEKDFGIALRNWVNDNRLTRNENKTQKKSNNNQAPSTSKQALSARPLNRSFTNPSESERSDLDLSNSKEAKRLKSRRVKIMVSESDESSDQDNPLVIDE